MSGAILIKKNHLTSYFGRFGYKTYKIKQKWGDSLKSLSRDHQKRTAGHTQRVHELKYCVFYLFFWNRQNIG